MEQEKTQQEEKKQSSVLAVKLRRKGILLGAAFVLLVTLLVMGATAWYTKVAEVSGINMEVAEYDFNANYQTDNFIINAFDYSNVDNYKIAPGGGGVIPIYVSTSQSAIDVNYSLGINVSDMAPEFQKRLRFYYFKSNGSGTPGEYTECTINPGEADTNVTGLIHANSGAGLTEYIYWEWVYDLSPKCYFNADTGKWINNGENPSGGAIQAFKNYVSQGFEGNTTDEKVQKAIDAHDQFDTEVGLGKYNNIYEVKDSDGNVLRTYEATQAAVRYASQNKPDAKVTLSAIQKAMEVRILITGAQAQPTKLAAEPVSKGSTVFNPKETPTAPLN